MGLEIFLLFSSSFQSFFSSFIFFLHLFQSKQYSRFIKKTIDHNANIECPFLVTKATNHEVVVEAANRLYVKPCSS